MTAPKRKKLTKTARFEIFKRDEFTCGYCGKKPPGVVLEIDHVTPVSSGGTNDEYNLLTSCLDCNQGKGARLLNAVPQSLADATAVALEREDQVKAYEAILKAQKRREASQIRRVETLFQERFEEQAFTKLFKISVRRFLERMPKDEVEEAMAVACGKQKTPTAALKYFCGICWRKIRIAEGSEEEWF